ncbi:hypothetical protein [Neobacillus massiliamazoniensis]|uniref:Uncharacterized protein n=1 Tax=Neobacillus massiliamazoniensis TaxID=1499688 RepID=A0A0U1NYC4_9BACI|nr:hypothetical protein [Neobacillus massiliamazoniensis]CRK82987.1 hypothetical protein BN000_02942 [Neobacillus massiliamazoniensis]
MNFDTKELNVVFPNEVLNGKKIESVMISPIDRQIGVAALTGKIKNMQLLRLYQIIKVEDGNFVPTHEIGAFTFNTKDKLKDFIKSLPEMSAIKILMLMNPYPLLSN